LITELKKLYIQKEDKKGVQDNFDVIQVLIDKIHADLDKKESKLQTVERFIDRYVPIRIQSQISETLGSILSQNMLAKLEQFEHDKFQQLNEEVLRDEFITLD
jgi:uncharacterized protein YlxP (DUF503 family)